MGVSAGTVRGWRGGSSPGWGDGEQLIGLWVERTGKTEEMVPRRLADPGPKGVGSTD